MGEWEYLETLHYIFNQETSKGVACLEEGDLSLQCQCPLIFHSESDEHFPRLSMEEYLRFSDIGEP